MSRVTEGPRGDVPAAGNSANRPGTTGAAESLLGKVVCPFCGQTKSTSAEPCPRCTMEDTPATRQATKARIGPWYVLQNRSPSAPGMKFSTLLWLVNKGHVTPRSIVRGPTTYQLWRYAAHVRGLSREFGLCYSCGGSIDKSNSLCPHCGRPQDPPMNVDVLLDLRDNAAGADLRPPSTRDVDPRPLRAAAEARRMPPPATSKPPERDDEPDAAEERQRSPEPMAPEPAAAERGRARGDLMVRQRQELARRGGGSLISATNLAVALQDPEDAPPRFARRFSILNVLLFVLVLAGGATAAFLYLKPEYRAPTAQWVSQTWATLRDKLASMQWSSPPGEPPARSVAQPPAPEPAPSLALDPPSPQAVQRVVPPATQPLREPAVNVAQDASPPQQGPDVDAIASAPQRSPQSSPPPAPQLARDTTSPAQPEGTSPAQGHQPEPAASGTAQLQPQAEPPPPVTPQRKPDPRASRSAERPRQPQNPPPQTDPQPGSSEPKTIEQAREESRRLYRMAIDAEGRDDYAAALQLYEQIKTLPREAWPGGLQIRINLATDQLKSQAKSD